MKFWTDEGGTRQAHLLREGSSIIGRHPSCHIVAPGVHVSKKHLQCYVENNVVTIRDLGSSNGTFVNGSAVTSCVLKDGDEVSLGGYRLVFDAEGAQPGMAAQAGLDRAPTGATAPAGPPTPPESDTAKSELAFKAEAGEDDTPADGAFVPQAYAPQSLQPQVVARDGRMYLRDPRTSREVEIVPRRPGAAAPELAGYYAEKEAGERRKNNYLIAGAIVVALLMIVALVFFSRPGADDTPKVPQKTFTIAQYNNMVDQSIGLAKEGKFKEAADLVRKADQEYGEQRVAGTMLKIIEEWQKSGKTLDEFNWLSVEAHLRDLRENRWSTSEVRAFAAGRVDWIYDVQHQQEIANKALAFLSEGDPEKALAEFAKLPPESLVRRKSEPQIANTRLACYNKFMQRGREALDRNEWNAAIAEYQAAGKYASTRAHKDDIGAGVAIAVKRLGEEQILNNANAEMRQDTPQALKTALRILAELPDTSPLAPKKVALRRRIEARIEEIQREAKAENVRQLYKSGRGPEAIELITRENLEALYPLRSKIERLLTLEKEAQNAFVKKDYELAQSKWQEITVEETDGDNPYHRAARQHLTEMEKNAETIAKELRDRADQALARDDPETARKLYLRAMKWDPRATIGKDGLAQIRHIAEITYNDARNLRYQEGQKEQAIQLFEKVLRYAEEGSDQYKNAKRHLSELRGH